MQEKDLIGLLQFVLEIISKSNFDERDLKKIIEQYALFTTSDSGQLHFIQKDGDEIKKIASYEFGDQTSEEEFKKKAMSLIVIPIIYKSKAIGVISLGSSKKNQYAKHHADYLNSATKALSSIIGEIAEKVLKLNLTITEEEKEYAFVLMPFHEPFNKYYKSIIKPSIEDAGLKSLRADEIFGPSNIIKDIWDSILRAKVVLAELTTRNANVLYELGICHAIGKPVVLFAQSLDDVPFDLRSLRCIIYDTIEPDWAPKLRESLSMFIKKLKEVSSEDLSDYLPFLITRRSSEMGEFNKSS